MNHQMNPQLNDHSNPLMTKRSLTQPWWEKPLMKLPLTIDDHSSLSLDEKIRYDWPIESCQSALIKPTRSKSVTITTRQSIDETDKESNIQAIGTILTVLPPS
jgi:hypothetical protein